MRPRSRRHRLLAVRPRLPPLDTAAALKKKPQSSPQIAPRTCFAGNGSKRVAGCIKYIRKRLNVTSGRRKEYWGVRYTVDSQGFIDKSDLYRIAFRSVGRISNIFSKGVSKYVMDFTDSWGGGVISYAP